MDSIWFILLQLTPILFLIYYYFRQKFNYWSQLGVQGPPPSLLNLGNVRQIQGTDPMVSELEFQQKYGKVYGTYTGVKPTLTISDAELIKQVMIKDFHLFVNRRQLATYHELVNNGIFFTDDEYWKRLRSVMSPSFSSGKLRKHVPVMNKCIGKFEAHLNQLVKGDGVMRDVRMDVIGMTIEVIAATSYGAQVDSNETNRSRENPFVKHALNLSVINPLVALSYFIMPSWFNKLVGVKLAFNEDTLDFFTATCQKLIGERRHQNAEIGQKPNDLMQLLIDARSDESQVKSQSFDMLIASMENDFSQNSTGGKKPLTESEIIASATGVFVAGFDTTSLNITMCLFELAHQPALQERLFCEIDDKLQGVSEDVNSEEYLRVVLNEMPYLEAVIKEAMRKYPALVRLERRLSGADEYKLNGIRLVRNQLAEISTVAVHYNPEYYPNPKLFDPDRFMPENKHKLVPYAYVPFGEGPRNCMGMRYAYQEMKLCLARIVRHFRFSSTEETPKELGFQTYKFVLSPVPFELKVDKRD